MWSHLCRALVRQPLTGRVKRNHACSGHSVSSKVGLQQAEESWHAGSNGSAAAASLSYEYILIVVFRTKAS